QLLLEQPPARGVDALADDAERPVRADDDLAGGRAQHRVARGGGHAGTVARRPWRSCLATFTAAEASGAYPSAPTASAYSWVTGAPPTMTMTWSRTPAF